MSIAWDPGQYLRFAEDRSRPMLDLLARVPAIDASTVVDLGCGAGNLTPLIRATFPGARVLGIDSSPEMVERARRDDPDTEYLVADVSRWRPDEPVDAFVSNAMLQWLPDRFEVLEDLAEWVAPGGVLALQVPANGDAPSHRLLFEVAGREPYVEHTAEVRDRHFVDGPELYLELFAGRGWQVDAWSTTYQHVLPGEDAVFEWISGTGARPVLQALPDDLRPRFEHDYKAALRQAYPRRKWGTVLPFRRTFCVARRPG